MLRVLGESVNVGQLQAGAETMGLAAEWREMESLRE